MSIASFGKLRHFPLDSSLTVVLVSLLDHNYSFNIVSRMTGIEDTSNTNSYSILSWGKQLFKDFATTNIREIFAEFPFP